MSTKKIVKTDRSQEPEIVKTITPAPPAPPEPVVEEVPVIEFSKQGDTCEGMYTGTNDDGHNFVANGRKFIIENTDDHKTINEALATVAESTLIRIEFLGFDDEEQRGLFEVSTIE